MLQTLGEETGQGFPPPSALPPRSSFLSRYQTRPSRSSSREQFAPLAACALQLLRLNTHLCHKAEVKSVAHEAQGLHGSGGVTPRSVGGEPQSRRQLLMRADVVVVVFTTQQQTGGDGDTVASVKGRTNEILIMMMMVLVLGRTNWAAARW